MISDPDEELVAVGLLEVGFDGTSIALWSSSTGQGEVFRAAVRRPGGTFGEPVTVTSVPPGPAFVALGAGQEGKGVVAWSGDCPENARVSFVRPRPSGGARSVWSPPEEIPNSDCPDAGLELALDDRGMGVLVINGSSRRWGGIRAAMRPPGGSFAPAELISRRGETTGSAELGMSGSGRAIVTSGVVKSGKWRIQAVYRPPQGVFTSPQRISGYRHAVSLGPLAVNRRGAAVQVWQSLRTFRLQASYMCPDRRFQAPGPVSPPLTRKALAEPVVAINRGGKELVAWSRPDPFHGGGHGIYFVEGPPNCEGSS